MPTKKMYRAKHNTPAKAKLHYVVQSVRLEDRANKRLKRAARKRKMSFNAWAVTVLTEAADLTINPLAPPTETKEVI